jgi:RNA polymerase sigma factor (TIGR02999 family)
LLLVSDITHILFGIARGDPSAAGQLLPLVYDELRKLAAQKLIQEKPGQTLEATALVHEAYLRLVGNGAGTHWDNRRHFFAAAAEAMRRILIEAARRKRGPEHGGHLQRRDLLPEHAVASDRSEELLVLDEALDRLAALEPRAVEVVKLRYFAGLTITEVADALGISPRTVDADWAYARAWLVTAIQDED